MFLTKQQLIIILHVAVCLQEKACEIVSLVRRRQLSIKEAWKAVNSQVKNPIFTLDLLWLKRKIRDCSVFEKLSIEAMENQWT